MVCSENFLKQKHIMCIKKFLYLFFFLLATLISPNVYSNLNFVYKDSALIHYQNENFDKALNSFNQRLLNNNITIRDSVKFIQIKSKIFDCLYQITEEISDYEDILNEIDMVIGGYLNNPNFEENINQIKDIYSKIHFEIGWTKLNIIHSSELMNCDLYEEVLYHFNESRSLTDYYRTAIDITQCYCLIENKNNKSIRFLKSLIEQIEQEKIPSKDYFTWNMRLNLGVSYFNIKDYQKSKKIHENLFTDLDKFYNISVWEDPKEIFEILNLINYANVLDAEGNYKSSIDINLKTLDVLSKIKDYEYIDSQSYINLINRNLATAYLNSGNIEESEKILLEISKVEEDSTNLAILYSDLSKIFQAKDNLVKSNYFLKKSLNFFGNSSHYLKSKSFELLYKNYFDLQDFNEASIFLEKMIDREIQILKKNEFFLPPEANLAQQKELLENIYKLYNLNLINGQTLDYKYWIYIKNRDLSQNIIFKTKLLESSDSVTINIYKNLLELRKQFFYLKQKDFLNGNDLGNYDFLNDKIESLQNRLYERIDFEKNNNVFTDYKENLANDDVLVDIIKLPIMNNRGIISKKEYNYNAFVLEKNREVYMLNIGQSDSLDVAFTNYKKYITSISSNISLNANAYSVLFKKIDSKIKETKRIVFFPDGIYNFINPISFYNIEKNEYVFDYRKFKLINSYNQIDETNTLDVQSQFNSITIFSNPEFKISVDKKNEDDFSDDELINILNKIPSLPATLLEKQSIIELFKQKGYKFDDFNGIHASEDNFKNNAHKNILHLATHGYYFDENKHNEIFQNDLKQNVDPYLLSGLLLSGAENTLQGQDLKFEDGWLTGLEIQSVNFSNTNLIVLSACETLLGESVEGRGVFGITHAIKKSGGKNIISSLWMVDDKSTQEFMKSFYTFLLEKKDISKSLNLSISKLRESYIHPYYWAPFVLIE